MDKTPSPQMHKELLRELMDAVDSGIPVDRIRNSPLAVRIDAALKQPAPSPEPEGREPASVVEQPSHEELWEVGDPSPELVHRWEVDGQHHTYETPLSIHIATQAARWGAAQVVQRHPAPVPVAERLPGPEDCDAELYCWRWNTIGGLWARQPLARSWYEFESHWLPANALPLPKGEVQQ